MPHFIFNKTDLRERNPRTKRDHCEIFSFLLKGEVRRCAGGGDKWVLDFQEGTGRRRRNEKGLWLPEGQRGLPSRLGEGI